MKKILVGCCVLFFGIAAMGDHLPEKLLAHGKPENSLAGINLQFDTPEMVLKKLGTPIKKINVPNNPGWTGYVWDTATTRLEVEVTRGKTRNYLDSITLVRLGGGAGSMAGVNDATGQGLKLGASLDELKSIYGSKLLVLTQKMVPASAEPFLETPGTKLAILQWTPLEFTLTAGLDSDGKIIALRLRLPECYPGGCQ